MGGNNKTITDAIVIGSGHVKWRDLIFLQQDNLKNMTNADRDRLRLSIIENGAASSFRVWKHKGKLYCLDGYHRCKIFELLIDEGYNVPDQFPAEFVKCRDMKHAAELVLVYSSVYATPDDQGLHEFQVEHGIDFGFITDQASLPGINPYEFVSCFGPHQEPSGGMPETGSSKEKLYQVIVDCDSEADQDKWLAILQAKGAECRKLTV